MYKLNPLLESNNKQDKEFKKAALGLGSYGLLLGGGIGIKNNLDKVTGVETRFHNTPESAADQILNQGILSKYASDPNNLTNTVLGDKAKNDLVYLAKNKSLADGVGRSRFLNRIDSSTGKTLKIKIPYDEYLKLKKVANPELRGAKNSKEFIDRLTNDPYLMQRLRGSIPFWDNDKYGKFIETANFEDMPLPRKKFLKRIWKNSYSNLSKGTDTIKGDISPEFIKGSQHFRKNMGRNNFLNYVKKHPGRFSKGVAGAGLGIAGLGGAVYLGKKSYDLNKK